MFYDSDILIGPHGAHMANTLCSREGSLLVEICCIDFQWMNGPSARESYLEPMGLKYVALTMSGPTPPGSCNGTRSPPNTKSFEVKYDVIRNLILDHRKQHQTQEN